MARRIGIGIVVLAFAGGCVGAIEGAHPERDESSAPTPSAPGTSTGSHDEPLVCDPQHETGGASPLRRLSRTELRNTLRDLFPTVFIGVGAPALDLPVDSLVDGFDNNAAAQTASPVAVEKWADVASTVATAVSAKLSTIVTCQPTTEAEQAVCARTFVKDFITRAYRRPLEAEETERFVGFVTAQAKTHGFAGATTMLVEAIVQSPSFLYRPELGAVTLSGHEIASRLSYLLWQTMPDATLFDAATKGELASKGGIEAQARRLLADPRARPAIADFHRQWLGLDDISTMRRDKTLFPAFADETPAALREATGKWVDRVFWEGTFEALLTEPKAYVNDLLAPLYGVPKPGTATLTLVDLDPTKRAGFLGQAGFLASQAHEKFDAPILRGVFVLDKMLCAPPPPPPPNVADIPPAETADVPRTTRQRIEQSHASAACMGCHDSIHGVGFLFNQYDAVGAWRDTENGLPIDAKGKVAGFGDVDGNYDGSVSFSQTLAKSTRVRECFGRQWFRFAFGRTETRTDGCAVKRMVDALATSGGNMREMLVQLVIADAFRSKGVQ